MGIELNAKACDSWVTTRREREVKEVVEVDPVQLANDIKWLDAEVKFKSKQIKQKLELLYQLKPTKETYDKIVSLELICNN